MDLTTVISSLSCGIFVYFVLSYLLVSSKITIVISIIMSMLIFGLTRYYLTSYDDKEGLLKPVRPAEIASSKCINSHCHSNKKTQSSIIIFICIYVIVLTICAFISKPDSHIYLNWSNIEATDILQLTAAILLCFFMPGYAVILNMTKKSNLSPLLTVLLAYLISILITGITEYFLASAFDISLFETKSLLIGTNILILVVFSISYLSHKDNSQILYHISKRFFSYIRTKLWIPAKSRASEIVVFGSLLTLLLVSSYYIFGGVTIGDQWFHQGRALLFMSGSFRQVALSGADSLFIPPFQSAFLASLATLSGIPLVNTYASIAFVSITPVFAFYYFFTRWVPLHLRRAGVLASCLFAIGSGFGWVYLFGLTMTTNPITSEKSVVETIASTGPYTFDVVLPVNFILAAHPDINTALIYIAIPAGFVLLGILRGDLQNRITFTTIVAAISILGILSHDEFYLFILVSSILPLFFKIKQGNYLYLGLFLAFLIVYVINMLVPGKSITAIEIFGVPLLILAVLYVIIAWALYLTKHNLHSVRVILSSKFRTKQLKNNTKGERRNRKGYNRVYFVMVVLLISVVVYMYGLSFVVWTQFSMDELKIQTSGYTLPWYLYPMKFGLTGILALTFVLSYLFRRFEKELFVFGILIVIALLAGPYYDEHRFSKYVMAGMIGFASLLVYRLLNVKYSRPIITRILLGALVICSSLSTIIFLGYNSLILQTQELLHTLGRRNFPTAPEMQLLQVLHDKTDLGSKRYNVVTFPNEYNYIKGGLIAKLQAFSGLPDTKLYQSPLTLNVSTLDGLYHLLDYSGTRYIIIPKESISQKLGLTEPTLFILNHFQRIYEDNKYIVLDVPEFASSFTTTGTDETALIYNDKDEKLSENVTDVKLLPYNTKTFNFGGETNFVIIEKGNQTKKAILSNFGENKGLTLWSRGINPGAGINNAEVRLKIVAENGTGNTDAGLKWKEAEKEYYLSISKNGLELFQKSTIKEDVPKLIYQNSEIEKNDLISYNLKIETFQDSLNVYVDDVLNVKIPKVQAADSREGISQLGIAASNGIVEFGPIKISNVSGEIFSNETKYNPYYYPLSILALSKSRYDMFTDQDLSALSKKQLMLTFDPLNWDDSTYNRYLDYVRKGGTLVVFNSDNNFKGRFGQLFLTRSNDNETASFSKISGENNQFLNISGLVKKVQINSSKSVNVIATYRDDANQTVSPFAVEKNFPNGGRIVYVNSEGYFNTISKSPRQYFLSLSNISSILNLDGESSVNSEVISTPAKRFVGEVNISGNVSLKSPSLMRLGITNNSAGIYAGRILISGKSNNESLTFNNVSIKDIKLIGQYEITINSLGTSTLPSMSSQHKYISISTPAEFNMTVNLSSDRYSSAEIVTLNNSHIKTIKVDNASLINLYGIKQDSLKSIPVILKTPEIKVSGHIGFNESNFDPYLARGIIPLNQEGNLSAKFDYVDNYKVIYGNGTTKMSYITYFQSITNNSSVDKEQPLKLPGDISPLAKKQGVHISLKEAIFSTSNIILLISVSALTVIVSWLIWPKIKLSLENKRD
jgi:hypothetical protein